MGPGTRTQWVFNKYLLNDASDGPSGCWARPGITHGLLQTSYISEGRTRSHSGQGVSPQPTVALHHHCALLANQAQHWVTQTQPDGRTLLQDIHSTVTFNKGSEAPVRVPEKETY